MAGEPNESGSPGPAPGPGDPEGPERARPPEPAGEPASEPAGAGATRVAEGAGAEEDRAAEPSGAPHGEGPTVTEVVSAPGPDGEPMRATREVGGFTRDTARPEGGGRAAPADAPAPARQWPIIAVLATTGAGLLLTGFGVFRVGTLLVGLALLLGAALRWCLPSVGMLAVRSRFTDMVTYGGLGLVIVLLALMVQPKPWLVIPFLDEVLHFTID
ncbi:DUF3017 domain-containing protein [Streptomyces sp. NPDC049954]|uniref:DUF3017 domain-containing protein n=1 Tax=Streptomyces sp. NPDC049954 TaxID=3155779 RepID=UPI00342A6435